MGYFGIPFRNGVPIGLGSVVSFGAQQFDPSELFVGGTVAGAWYDPSDLSTMFTTSAGTTPVAMPGQGAAVSVGLMLDKSQGLVGLGAQLVVNGDFSTGDLTNWQSSNGGSFALSSNRLQVTGAGANTTGAAYTLNTTVGAAYAVSFVVTLGTATVVDSQMSLSVAAGAGIGNSYQFIASNQTITYYFVATAATTYFQFLPRGTGLTAFIDDFSVKTLGPGNHAIAFNNTTARPELRARVNLLVATATLSTQNVTTQATSYTLSFAGAGSITLSGTATGSYSAGTHTITCTAGTLTLTVSGTVTTADLRPANSGALLPAYQAVVDANTYDTSGFPLYLRFDGIDDSMYTPANLNLSGTDKVAVFAGVRKLSDVAQGVVAELSATIASNNGTFLLAAPDGATQTYGWDSKGTTQVDAVASSLAAPRTNVLVGTADIAGDSCIIRVNGAVADTEAGDQGSGNYGTYPLYIGARNNSSLWLNGQVYGLLVVGSAVSAGNISATEQYIANKTGIQI